MICATLISQILPPPPPRPPPPPPPGICDVIPVIADSAIFLLMHATLNSSGQGIKTSILEDMEEQLSAKDLSTMYSDVFDAAMKWYNLGLALGLLSDELDKISSAHCDEPDVCLREVLKLWLSKSFLHPTRKALICTLRQRAIGFQQLADELEMKYKNINEREQVRSAAGVEPEPSTGSFRKSYRYQKIPGHYLSTVADSPGGKLDSLDHDEIGKKGLWISMGKRKGTLFSFYGSRRKRVKTELEASGKINQKQIEHARSTREDMEAELRQKKRTTGLLKVCQPRHTVLNLCYSALS